MSSDVTIYSPRIKNRKGEWLVYYILSSTDLHIAIGKYPNRAEAIKAIYYSLLCHIDDCCSSHDRFTYYLSDLKFLEGGEDMYVDLICDDSDCGKRDVLVTGYLIKIVEDDFHDE